MLRTWNPESCFLKLISWMDPLIFKVGEVVAQLSHQRHSGVVPVEVHTTETIATTAQATQQPPEVHPTETIPTTAPATPQPLLKELKNRTFCCFSSARLQRKNTATATAPGTPR